MERKSFKLLDGTTISFLEAGSGSPMISIPGWSQTAAEFQKQIAALSATRRVLAFDMRGHGESSKEDKAPRIQRLAKDVLELIKGLGLTKPDVMGHSMGCSVMWAYLSMFGEDVPLGKLVMVDQAPCVLGQPGWDAKTIANAGILFADMEGLIGFESAVVGAPEPGQVKELIRGMFTNAVAETDLDFIAAENVKMDRGAAAHLLHDHCVLDWREEIRRITNPALVIGGQKSIFSAQSQQWVAGQIPGAQVEIFEADQGGGHFMFWENADRFNGSVAAFLQSG